jgi:predicted amidohydrolase
MVDLIGESKNMRIALCQMNITWEDKQANYIKAEKFISDMSEKENELILFPEMSFTGFSMNTNITKEADKKTISIMKVYAKRYGIDIGFGWVKDCGKKSENHYTIVNKNGVVISDYAKIHPFSYSGEDKKFKGGDKLTIFDIKGITFSNFICYDLRFPEIFQMVSEDTHVIIIPANWPKVRREHWKCLLKARAIENQVYILAVNSVGEIDGINYSGDSCIINPNGDLMAEISGEEGCLKWDLCDDVQEYRRKFPIKKDRHENYMDLRLKENGNE